MSEYANRRDRGKLVTMVFAMQGVGLILGPLVAIALLLAGLDHDLTWRMMLALGAVPALATFYLRRQIAETPRFALMMQGDLEAAAATVSQVTGQNGHGHNGAHPSALALTQQRSRPAPQSVAPNGSNSGAQKKRSSDAPLICVG
jgi:MFS family permease